MGKTHTHHLKYKAGVESEEYRNNFIEMTSTLFLLRFFFLVLELTIHMYIYYILSKFQHRFIGRILMMPTGHINSQSEVGRQNIDLCNNQKGWNIVLCEESGNYIYNNKN